MISYKRYVLERQSLSEVKMSRGSPIYESVRKKIVEYLGLGDMAKKIITIILIIFFISVDIDNYHDKCQIFISFKFKPRILLQSESCRNQTIHFP